MNVPAQCVCVCVDISVAILYIRWRLGLFTGQTWWPRPALVSQEERKKIQKVLTWA